MIKLTSNLVFAPYRALPEWLARSLAICVVLTMLAAAIVFLYYRPMLRKLQAAFNSLRH